MVEAWCAELAHAEPFDVQRDHSTLGQVDAPNLLVIGGLSLGVVAVDVEDYRDLPFELRRLVEQGRNPEAREGLVAQLPYGVTWSALQDFEPLDAALCIAP